MHTGLSSLTFSQAPDGLEVVGTEVQPSIHRRGDPQKPFGVISEKQVLLRRSGVEELERRMLANSKILLMKEKWNV